MGQLVSLCEVKTFLEIPDDDTSRDGVLRQLIRSVSSLVEEYCGRTFGANTYEEYYSGDNTPILVLNQRPVSAIINIWEDTGGYWGQSPDAFNSASLLVSGTNYALEIDQADGSSRCGLVYRINGTWPCPFRVSPGNLSSSAPYGVGNLKVIYEAGYSAVPETVKIATELSISRIWRMGKYGGLVQSEQTPGYSWALATSVTKPEGNLSLSPEAISMLGRFRNFSVA
jgi:hypothetical protein